MLFPTETVYLDTYRKPFLDELSYISFKSSLNESFGIAELDNEKFQDSLKEAAQKISVIIDKMRKSGYSNNRCSLEAIREDGTLADRYDNLEIFSFKIKGASWISEANVLIECKCPNDYNSFFEYRNNVPEESDGLLLGDYEEMIRFNPGKWKEISIHLEKRSLFRTSDIHIPLKISYGKITQCFVLLTIGQIIPSVEEIKTILNHEIGHAKDVLDHQSTIKDNNADLIDLGELYRSYINLENNPVLFNRVDTMHKTLSDRLLSSTSKQQFINSNNFDEDVIMSWFLYNRSYFNSSEIVQHRKNFLLEIKSALEKHQFDCSVETYLHDNSEEYRSYSEVAQVMRSFIDFAPNKIKQKVVDDFIKPIVSADRGDEHRRYMYGKVFAGRNKNFGVNAFDEFFLFHIKRIEKYFIERSRRLFNAIVSLKNRSRHNIYESSYRYAMKKIVECAEEELLID